MFISHGFEIVYKIPTMKITKLEYRIINKKMKKKNNFI